MMSLSFLFTSPFLPSTLSPSLSSFLFFSVFEITFLIYIAVKGLMFHQISLTSKKKKDP